MGHRPGQYSWVKIAENLPSYSAVSLKRNTKGLCVTIPSASGLKEILNFTREDASELFRGHTFSNHLVTNLFNNLSLWLVQYNLTMIDLGESAFFIKSFRSTLK